jgi:hypothetical protein
MPCSGGSNGDDWIDVDLKDFSDGEFVSDQRTWVEEILEDVSGGEPVSDSSVPFPSW